MQTAVPKKATPASAVFLTGADLRKRYNRSRVTIWRWINDVDIGLPKPMEIRGNHYWLLTDLEAWEAAQKVAA